MLVLLAPLLFCATPQDEGRTDAERFNDLAGAWQGELIYRDYQSDKEVALPAALDARASADGAALVAEVAFEDPGWTARSLNVSTFPSASALVEVEFSGGRIERQEWQIERRQLSGKGAWTYILSGAGQDDGHPAEFRMTRTLDDQRFTSIKEVRRKDRPDAEWIVRNRLELTRVAVDERELIGEWSVDLRPTPDADPYLASLTIESIQDGVLAGRFYGTAIENGRVNTAWGAVHFAFTTSDGTGTYHTAGVWKNGVLSGTTHSVGRAFLSVWTGERGEPGRR